MVRDKILVCLPNDNLGGAEQYLKMVAEYYLNERFEVDVYFLKKSESGAWNDLESTNFRLHFTNKSKEKWGVLSCLRNLYRNKNSRYSYVFTSHIHLNSFISLLRKFNIVKSDFHIARESTSTFKRYRGLKLFLFKAQYLLNYSNIDLLICQTNYMYDQLKAALPHLVKKIKVRVLSNPVNLVRSASLLAPDTPPYRDYVVSAGRLIHEKGFDILIDAFNSLQSDFPHLSLIILGEGQQRNMLEKKIKVLNLSSKVFLPGFVKDVYPYFNNASLCVVSSRIEGFPNVLLQMMSQNPKVVSTICAGGIDELPGVFTCPTNDSDALFESMESCLKSDTTGNKALFKEELETRSIGSFIAQIKRSLEITSK